MKRHPAPRIFCGNVPDSRDQTFPAVPPKDRLPPNFQSKMKFPRIRAEPNGCTTRPALARDLFTNASRDAAPLRKYGLRLDRQKSSRTANYQESLWWHLYQLRWPFSFGRRCPDEAGNLQKRNLRSPALGADPSFRLNYRLVPEDSSPKCGTGN